ncbi:MAG TPA: YbhN family protein [Acidimicrobiales bacterium]|nr:YbhN family protein [Acidimicrobiales bacterium]
MAKEEMLPAPAGTARRRRRLRIPRLARHGLTLFVLLLVVEYLVIPDLVVARKSLHAIEQVNVALLVVAFLLEVAAQLAYARLTLVVLPPGALSFSKVLRINMSALGVSHILPGGTAGGTGLGYRLMTTNGVKGTDVGFAAATQGIGSAVVLNVLLWSALVVSIPIELATGHSHHESAGLYIEIAAVGTVLLSLAAGLVYAFTRGQSWARRVLRALARRLPFLTEAATEQFVVRVNERLRALGSDRRLLARGVLWATANWLLDAACLWICLSAFHQVLDPVVLLVAYGVGNVLAAIPLTPGGLGPVEAATAFVLRGFGVPSAIALLAVLAWRLYNFWLPIPVGAASYVSLRVGRGASVREQRRMLGEMALEAREPIGDEAFEQSRLVHAPFERREQARAGE